MDLRVAAYAVIIAEGRMLLAHWSQNGHSGWTLPGGGIEPGEDPEDAAVREIEEETGYTGVLEGLLGIDSIVVPTSRRLSDSQVPMHGIRIVYRASVVAGELRNELYGSTDEAAWFPLDEVQGLERVELVDIGLRMLTEASSAGSRTARP
jgi:8-oxo-dGTP diphosphatase